MSADTAGNRPTLRIVRGNPSAEDVATIVAVLSSATVGGEVTSTPSTSGWGAPSAMHRPPMPAPGAGAWLQLGHR